MSAPEPHPEPRARSRVLSAIMVLIGVILLLPGVCVVITAFMTVPMAITEVSKRLLHGPPLDSGFWPIMAGWAVFWLICLSISYLGIQLIRRAWS